MNFKQYFNDSSSTNLWKLLIIIIIVVGIGLRFFNLDQKVYSADEVRSIMRFSGYTTQQVKDSAFQGEILSVKDLQHFQRPNSDRSLSDAIAALSGNPEHPPLYHLLTRFWMQLFPISARTFSILCSIIAMPCLYWFCMQLFESALTGWIAIALFSVSPFHILAAQNTTQYSLWTVAILLSGGTLIKALREKTKTSWVLYSVSLAFAFYTHLFSSVVAISQAIYVLCVERFKLTKNLLSYGLAGLGSLLLFTPWLVVIVSNRDKIAGNTQYYRQFKTNLVEILQTLFRHSGHVFVDFFHRKGKLEFFLNLLIFCLVVYSLYYLIRFTAPKVWLFVITLIAVPVFFQVVPDLISQSIRSLQARYYLPAFLGIQLSVSYFLAQHINVSSPKKWLKYFWQQILILLLLLGVLSGVFLAQTPDGGLDDQRGTASSTNIPIAKSLNKMQNPLVISESTPSFFLALSYLVNDQVKFQLLEDQNVAQWQKKLDLNQVKNQYSNLVVMYPDEKFLGFLKSQYSIETTQLAEELLEIKVH